MRKPNSMKGLEDLGRVRLSRNYFFRDFLFSEIAAVHGIANLPDDPDLAIESGRRLCEDLLEPLQATFGRLHLRSGYRSAAVNEFGNRHGLNCSTNAASAADHIWDMRDAEGCMGATACIVVPWLIDHCHEEGDWRKMAWWIHDHLPYASLCFFPKLWAFNIQWHERPARRIMSYAEPRGVLTKPGMANHEGDHSSFYENFPAWRTAG
nr:peptidase M15 [Rhizobium sp. TCK]